MATSHQRSPSEPSNLDRDRRSSSLSDIGDTAGTDDLGNIDHDNDDDSESNDTEAETERLEDSPFKRQTYKNVVLGAGKVAEHRSESSAAQKLDNSLQQTLSASSSLDESSDQDDVQPPNTTWSPRKRKRSSVDDESEISLGLANQQHVEVAFASRSNSSKSSPIHTHSHEDDDLPMVDSRESDQSGRGGISIRKSKQSFSTGKSTRPSEQDTSIHDSLLVHDEVKDGEESVEAMDSNAEDVEGEDVDTGELDITSKSQEELARKKSALNSLTALEKCFATLRDKLFDERLAAANEELAILQTTEIIHPELLAMRESVDAHCEQKINYQRTFLRLKLETLQKESIATKHQVHSQYIQSVRELRDEFLDRLNKEFYQVQRERRSADGDSSHLSYLFPNSRPEQIMQQTAYNSEVSILSGIAKYIGFPAAPSVNKANQAELEEDFRSMGLIAQPAGIRQNQLHSFKADLDNPNRQANTAEERFIESNAWANPQHPIHQRQPTQRQPSQPPHHHFTPVLQNGSEDVAGPDSRRSSSDRPRPFNATPARLLHTSRHPRVTSSSSQRDGGNADRLSGSGLQQSSGAGTASSQSRRVLNGSPISNEASLASNVGRRDGVSDIAGSSRANQYPHNHDLPPSSPPRPAFKAEDTGQTTARQSPVGRPFGHPTSLIASGT